MSFYKYPITVDSTDNIIDFWVSTDGKISGLSQAGLARLCGIAERAIFSKNRIGWLLDNPDPNLIHKIPEQLRPFINNLYAKIPDFDNDRVKIIDSKAAVALISYYANKKKPSLIARKSLLCFASMGFDSWVRQTIRIAHNPVTNLAEMKEFVKMVAERQKAMEKSFYG